MSALEETLFEKIRGLDENNQIRVLEFVNSLQTPKKSWDEWLAETEKFQAELRAKYGENFVFNSVDVLNEIREERLDDITGSR